MKKKVIKTKWAIIFWTEECTYSVIKCNDLIQVNKNILRRNWIGDLPWIDDQGILELYEAKVLRISYNKKYIEGVIVDVFGRIIQDKQNDRTMAEKLKVTKTKKKKQNMLMKRLKQVEEETNDLEYLHDDSEDGSLQNDTQQADSEENAGCESCKKCICKSWISQVTPEFVAAHEMQSMLLRKYLEAQKFPMPSSSLVPELYPNTGVKIKAEILDNLFSQANGYKRTMVRLLLDEILKEETSLETETAEKVNQRLPGVRKAVIGYMKKRYSNDLTTAEYNDILNKKIQYMRQKKLPAELQEDLKMKSRERARKSRAQKDDQPSTNKRMKKSSTSATQKQSDSDESSIRVRKKKCVRQSLRAEETVLPGPSTQVTSRSTPSPMILDNIPAEKENSSSSPLIPKITQSEPKENIFASEENFLPGPSIQENVSPTRRNNVLTANNPNMSAYSSPNFNNYYPQPEHYSQNLKKNPPFYIENRLPLVNHNYNGPSTYFPDNQPNYHLQYGQYYQNNPNQYYSPYQQPPYFSQLSNPSQTQTDNNDDNQYTELK